MLNYSALSELAALSKYDRVMVYLSRNLTEPYSAAGLPDEIRFTQATVREAMEKAVREGVIDKAVANVPVIWDGLFCPSREAVGWAKQP